MTDQITIPVEVHLAEAQALEAFLKQRCAALGAALYAAQTRLRLMDEEMTTLRDEVVALQAEIARMKQGDE